jgi:endonuclease YncB( thermonuclease family)
MTNERSISPIDPDGYKRLLREVRNILAAGKERARKAVEMERVRTYWEAGGMLKAHLQDRDSQYGEQVINKLSVDIDLPAHLIYEMIQFRKLIVNFAPGRNLTWSHYRRLIRIADESARKYYLQEATRRSWGVRQLEAEIKADAYGRGATAGQIPQESGDLHAPGVPRLVAKRGELYIYRVKEREGRRVLDLGFKDHRRLPEGYQSTFELRETVRSIRDDAQPLGFRYERAEKRKKFYAYRATVLKVIDGDTLWAVVDYGFEHTSDEKLRLRAIDTPELGTQEGERAKAHLEELLLAAQPFVITTTKVDLYDRYLTDVFVLPGEKDLQKVAREGRYVNRELIEEGFARRWTQEKPPEF